MLTRYDKYVRCPYCGDEWDLLFEKSYTLEEVDQMEEKCQECSKVFKLADTEELNFCFMEDVFIASNE